MEDTPIWRKVVQHPAVQKRLAAWWQKAQKDAPAMWSASFRTQKMGESLWLSAKAMREETRTDLERHGGVGGLAVAWVAGDVSLRLGWTGWKERVLGAWRVGALDAELMEAFQIYLLHEHLISSYRAQGVVVLKLLEREAEVLLSRLPGYRRQQLVELAVQIRDAGLKTAEQTRGDANCGQCVRKLAPTLRGGDCCGGMVFLGWDETDAVFRVLLGERSPVLHSFEGDPTRCGFLSSTGCVLTPGTRPTVCTAYYCGPYKEDLANQQRWETLAKTLLELNDGRRAMNFKLNLSKRFVLHEISKANSTHPLDFIWDRLRMSGAEISAVGKRQDGKNRLNVVS